MSVHALFLFFIFIHTYLNCQCFFHISFCNTNLHFYFSEICKYCVIKLYVNDNYVLTNRKMTIVGSTGGLDRVYNEHI